MVASNDKVYWPMSQKARGPNFRVELNKHRDLV